jgi:copper(I)-binding protein
MIFNKHLQWAALASLAMIGSSLCAMQAQAEGAMSSMSSMSSTSMMSGAPVDEGVVVGTLTISGAFARATLPNAPVGGAFMTIVNNGANADRLVSATSPAAGQVQFHEMQMEGEVMKMRELSGGLEIPAGGSVSLSPGGAHLMFTKLNQRFVEGEKVPVTLTFQNAGSVTLDLTVAGVAADAPAHSAM